MPKKVDFSKAVQTLRRFYKSAGRPPSFDEIRDLFGYKSKNAAFWIVEQLIQRKLLKKDAKGKLIFEPQGSLRLLGSIQAGMPTPAEEQLLDTLNLEDYLVRKPEETFLVKVTGDSMVDAGIKEGDLAVIERGKAPKNGDVVAAQADGDWTLKTFEKTPKGPILNKKYPVIRPAQELRIGGVLVGVIRKYT
jgi:SOS regulatory protein LexA